MIAKGVGPRWLWVLGTLGLLLAVSACAGGQNGVANPDEEATNNSVPIAVLIATLALVLVACAGEGAAPAPSPTAPPKAEPISAPEPTLAPTPELLRHTIPPCTPIEGSSLDPCQPGDPRWVESGYAEEIITLGEDGGPPGPFPIDFYLGTAWSVPSFVSHLVVRGTYLPGTIRCMTSQMNRYPSYYRTTDYLQDWGPGGTFRMTCFADVRVGEYILGSGPATLTVMVAMINYFSTPDHWPAENIAYDLRATEEAFINAGSGADMWVPVGLPGQERILFLNPSRNTLIEAWQAGSSPWDVQREEGGTAMAIHPDRGLLALLQRPVGDVPVQGGNDAARLQAGGAGLPSDPPRQLRRPHLQRP